MPVPTILFMLWCVWQDLPCSPHMPRWHRPVGAQGMAGYGPRYCGWLEHLTLSAPPAPRATPSGRPRSVIPSRPDRVGKERAASRGPAYPRSEKGSRSQTVVPPRPGLLVGDRIVVLACHYVSGPAQARAVAAPPAGPGFAGSGSIGDPWFMTPTNIVPPYRQIGHFGQDL